MSQTDKSSIYKRYSENRQSYPRQPISSDSRSKRHTFSATTASMTQAELQSRVAPSVGDSVFVPAIQQYGILRYLGPLHVKPGQWAGVELSVVGMGKNDGSVQDIRYFSCPPNTGVFVPANKLFKDDMAHHPPSRKSSLSTNRSSVSLNGNLPRTSSVATTSQPRIRPRPHSMGPSVTMSSMSSMSSSTRPHPSPPSRGKRSSFEPNFHPKVSSKSELSLSHLSSNSPSSNNLTIDILTNELSQKNERIEELEAQLKQNQGKSLDSQYVETLQYQLVEKEAFVKSLQEKHQKEVETLCVSIEKLTLQVQRDGNQNSPEMAPNSHAEVKQMQDRINDLEKLVSDLKLAGKETLDMYESTIKQHELEMQELQGKFDRCERQLKNSRRISLTTLAISKDGSGDVGKEETEALSPEYKEEYEKMVFDFEDLKLASEAKDVRIKELEESLLKKPLLSPENDKKDEELMDLKETLNIKTRLLEQIGNIIHHPQPEVELLRQGLEDLNSKLVNFEKMVQEIETQCQSLSSK